jgi:hypothetical protein
MALLKHVKTNGITVYVPKDTILNNMSTNIKLSQHLFLT